MKKSYKILAIFVLLIAVAACTHSGDDEVAEGKDFTFSVANGHGDTAFFVMKFINKKPSKGIARNYMIAETETTQSLLAAVCGKKIRKRLANYPVTDISFVEAEEFIAKLNEIVKAPYDMKFCLPTADEWLYAADGGKNGFALPFAGCHSKDQYTFYAWYAANSDGKVHETKTLQPNQLKLYDMNGNVWEWCRLKNSAFAGGTRRPLRGSAYNESNIWRSDYDGNNPVDSYKSPAVGFRLCLERIN